MELAAIIETVNFAMNVVGKIAFLFICIYFGNLAYKGWKGKKNLIIRIILTLTLGLISFFGGIILQDYLKISFFLSDYLSSMAIAIICFFLISMISSAFSVKNKYATKNRNIEKKFFKRIQANF